MKGISIGLLVSVGLSCDPRSFDDLADTTWVQFAERDDSQVPGRFGVAVTAVPLPANTTGARFVVSSEAPAGLTRVTFDSHGSKSEQIGSSISPALTPLISDTGGASGNNILALAPFINADGSTAFVAGQFKDGSIGVAGIMPIDLQTGGKPLAPPTSLSQDVFINYGYAVAAGDLGTTGANGQDVVVQSNNALTLIPGNGSAKRACNLLRTNPPTNGYGGGLNNLVIAPVKKNGHSQVIVGARVVRATGNNIPVILILDASDIVDGAHCPELKGVAVGADGAPGPSTIVVGDFDGNGNPDIAYAQTVNSGMTATFGLFPNITDFTGATPQIISLNTAADIPSAAFGSTMAAADMDGDTTHPGDELMVGDPGAQVNHVNAAGQVLVFKFDRTGTDCGSATANRGPLCVLTYLFNPDPSSNGGFGQALAVTPFPTPTSSTHVLAAAEANKLWVYFRIVAGAMDPRN